ncbi:MAG: hypothetical protein Q9214_001863 [Letrouitia sp. 1 TL-2023]
MAPIDSEFPYSLTLSIPLPDYRLASYALRALQVDAELSPLVRRSFSVQPPVGSCTPTGSVVEDEGKIVLRVDYKATTNRMLRVAVNGFMESLSLILHIMEELDEDILAAKST